MKKMIPVTVLILCVVFALGESDHPEFVYDGDTLIGYNFEDGRKTRWSHDANSRLLHLLPTIGGINYRISYTYYEDRPKKDQIRTMRLENLDMPTTIQTVRYDYDPAGRTTLVAETINPNLERVQQIEYNTEGEHVGKISKRTITQPMKNSGNLVVEETYLHMGEWNQLNVRKTVVVNNQNIGSVVYQLTNDAAIIQAPGFTKTTRLVNNELQVDYESDDVNGECNYNLETGSGTCSITSTDDDEVERNEETIFGEGKVQSEEVKLSYNGQELYSRNIGYTDGEVNSFIETKNGQTTEKTYTYEDGKLTETDDVKITYGTDFATLAYKADDIELDLFRLNMEDGFVQGTEIIDGTLTAALKEKADVGELNGEEYETQLDAPIYSFDLAGNIIEASYADGETEEFYYGSAGELILYKDKENQQHHFLEGAEVNIDDVSPSPGLGELTSNNIFIQWIDNVKQIIEVFDYLKNSGLQS